MTVPVFDFTGIVLLFGMVTKNFGGAYCSDETCATMSEVDSIMPVVSFLLIALACYIVVCLIIRNKKHTHSNFSTNP